MSEAVSAIPESSDPSVVSPLAAFAGERPPAPAWFEHAIAQPPERSLVPVEGCDIELLAWGERGRPGLLLLHGNGAHADWWSFVAPFLSGSHRVAAVSWSGMGRSGWREVYDYPTFLKEAVACAEAAGLFEADERPIIVAHSFGGGVATYIAAQAGDRFEAAVSGPPASTRRWRRRSRASAWPPPSRARICTSWTSSPASRCGPRPGPRPRRSSAGPGGSTRTSGTR